MPEYIERENAIAWFMPYAHAGEGIDADIVISDIKGMKAVDVAPVRHGRWIDRPSTKGQVYCSECATIEKSTDSNYKSRRCPNCGAKMDGGAD